MTRIALTGAAGLLGRTLQRRLAGRDLRLLTRKEADLTDQAAVAAVFDRSPADVVIHAAAMTAVDACESRQVEAHAANAIAAENVARACAAHGTYLIAISTDYVFAGDLGRPYREDDPPNPRTVYGRTKLAGERAIQGQGAKHTILRTAWLYGPGGPSFVHTMIKLGSQAGEALKVVDDQRGNPTSTDALADVILGLLDTPVLGVVHASCEGETTWFGFAQAIWKQLGLQRPVRPCTTAEYPRPAPRPANSRLEKRALSQAGFPMMPHWESALQRFLKEYPHG